MNKKTLVVGASPNPQRYAYKAILSLLRHGNSVVALGSRPGFAGDLAIVTEKPLQSDFDTVTLYIGPQRQSEYYEYIRDLGPSRVIFNPGTENPGFETFLRDSGIQVVEACTLVLLATNQY